MLTRTSILSEYIRLKNRYRDVYVDVFEKDDGYTVIIYCGIKPDDKVRLFKEPDRLVAYIGEERFEYEDMVMGEATCREYKYMIKNTVKGGYKIKNYTVDKDALIIKLERG